MMLNFPLAVLAVTYLFLQHTLAIPTPPSTEKTIIGPITDPLTDPFYRVPVDVSSYSPGEVIRSRPVLTLVTGASVESYQLLYRTTNQQNEATATVATIWAPALPAKRTKVFSYQIAEDSVSITCANSWAWANSSSPQGSNALDKGFIVTWALSQGWYVVSADFEGPQSAFLVGLIEARGVLDGIRAIAKYFGLDKEDFDVGLLGYSGAAHATVWASSFAATYAPELKVIGAAYGGTPIDLTATLNLVNGGEFAAEGIAAFVGNSIGFPVINQTIYPLLNTKGRKIWAELQAPGFCLLSKSSELAGTNLTNLFTRDILTIPLVRRNIAEQSLLSNKSPLPIPVPKFPRLEWHGLNDTNVPVQPEIDYVRQQCAKGADIRFGLFPGLNHVPNELNGLPGALLFMQQAFAGTLVKGKCGSNTTFPDIGSPVALELLGIDTNAALESLFIEAVKASS